MCDFSRGFWTAFVSVLCLAGPVGARSQGLRSDYDLWGNKYPPECHGDLAEIVMPVRVVPPSQMRPGYIGECVNCQLQGDSAYIMLDERLVDERYGKKWRTEAIKHEKCHRKMFLLGHDIYWHDDPNYKRK